MSKLYYVRRVIRDRVYEVPQKPKEPWYEILIGGLFGIAFWCAVIYWLISPE